MRLGASLGAIGILSVAPHGVATAQDVAPEDGGVLFELTASQSVRASDNPDLENPATGEVLAVTGLDGTLSSVTRSNALIVNFAAALEVGNDGFELGDTGVGASYTMLGQGSEFELFADYFTASVDGEFVEGTGGAGSGDIFVSDGTRNTYGYGARLLLGENGPFILRLRGERREVDYDSTDPGLNDSRSLRLNGSVSAAIDGVTTARVTAGYTETDEDDADNTFETNIRAGLGITRELGNASTVSADVDWQEIRTTTVGTVVTSGVGGRLAFERDLPNGAFGASANREITVDGTIDEFRLNRQIEFPASSLGLEAGIVVTGGDTVSPLLGVTYERLAPDGRFSVSLTQSAALDGDDQTALTTVGAASYTRSINALSSYAVEVSVTNQSVIDIDDTTRRIDGSISYNRALTDRVSLSTGYEHARIFETGTPERTSNTVFVTLSRNFSARP